MAITKKKLKTKPVCKVTFSHMAPEATEVFLVGDFNEWDATATPLKKLKSGLFKVVVDLEIEKSYQYKYIADGTYVNDEEPEALVFNEFANAENSLIEL
ncbi:isoamylase early set domain-containing protein [Wenyingzhuangia sp. 2_MG-2023]|uniref:isoamylase early set domain-containing protein n=1 Tax=Wenyingzhuangia sp. 2_MG-2023 TaxID=3062639 RepID=UPI0026E1CDF9|nr:isoamylase early set domain-containing protein [Wenyingzhuangia sp. 2_MG-2023]MDO6737328.1 isoamylase early set domain-containing protein [Wenyingzhuangia sp. 2_MG-2023]MDO6803089.1 isoamylase early set domain-containing protein [Wenyingzhuangia sp. 1_MG-2023]